MDRCRAALVLLLAFVVCTGVAIVVSGSRSDGRPVRGGVAAGLR